MHTLTWKINAKVTRLTAHASRGRPIGLELRASLLSHWRTLAANRKDKRADLKCAVLRDWVFSARVRLNAKFCVC